MSGAMATAQLDSNNDGVLRWSTRPIGPELMLWRRTPGAHVVLAMNDGGGGGRSILARDETGAASLVCTHTWRQCSAEAASVWSCR